MTFRRTTSAAKSGKGNILQLDQNTVEIQLEDSAARGRNGQINAHRVVIAGDDLIGEKRLTLEVFGEPRATTKQAPVRLSVPASYGAAIYDAVGQVLGLNKMRIHPHQKTSAEYACQGLDPVALERLGTGGLARLLKTLEQESLKGQLLGMGQTAIGAISQIKALIPVEEPEAVQADDSQLNMFVEPYPNDAFTRATEFPVEDFDLSVRADGEESFGAFRQAPPVKAVAKPLEPAF